MEKACNKTRHDPVISYKKIEAGFLLMDAGLWDNCISTGNDLSACVSAEILDFPAMVKRTYGLMTTLNPRAELPLYGKKPLR